MVGPSARRSSEFNHLAWPRSGSRPAVTGRSRVSPCHRTRYARLIFEQTFRALFSLFTIHGSHFGGLSPAALFQFGVCPSLQLPRGGSIANSAAAQVTPRHGPRPKQPEKPQG